MEVPIKSLAGIPLFMVREDWEVWRFPIQELATYPREATNCPLNRGYILIPPAPTALF